MNQSTQQEVKQIIEKHHGPPEGFDSSIDLRNIHALLIGPAKVGKSICAASWPGPNGIIDIDGGMLSITTCQATKQRAKDGDIFWRTIKRLEIKDEPLGRGFDEVVEAMAALEKVDKRSVVLDSLTTFTTHAVNKALEMQGKPRHTKPTFDTWDSAKSLITAIINQMFSWDCHVIVVAHDELMQDKLTGAIYRVPIAIGNQKGRLPIHFNEVWHFDPRISEKGEAQQWITFSPNSSLIGTAGSQLGLTGAAGTNLFDGVMEVYKGQGGSDALIKKFY